MRVVLFFYSLTHTFIYHLFYKQVCAFAYAQPISHLKSIITSHTGKQFISVSTKKLRESITRRRAEYAAAAAASSTPNTLSFPSPHGPHAPAATPSLSPAPSPSTSSCSVSSSLASMTSFVAASPQHSPRGSTDPHTVENSIMRLEQILALPYRSGMTNSTLGVPGDGICCVIVYVFYVWMYALLSDKCIVLCLLGVLSQGLSIKVHGSLKVAAWWEHICPVKVWCGVCLRSFIFYLIGDYVSCVLCVCVCVRARVCMCVWCCPIKS